MSLIIRQKCTSHKTRTVAPCAEAFRKGKVSAASLESPTQGNVVAYSALCRAISALSRVSSQSISKDRPYCSMYAAMS